jgi:hypothetical protein
MGEYMGGASHYLLLRLRALRATLPFLHLVLSVRLTTDLECE